MKNGLYKVQFRTPRGEGYGVVVLENGRLLGGDSSMYYVGSYKENDDQFSAEVQVDQHTKISGMVSVFGLEHVHITLTGRTSGETATMTGKAAEVPAIAFQATLSLLNG